MAAKCAKSEKSEKSTCTGRATVSFFSLSLCSFFDHLVAVVRSWLLHLCDRKILLIDDGNGKNNATNEKFD